MAKALDEAIDVLGGRTYAELAAPGGRTAAKEELSHRVQERYHGEVLDVYFTEFVMQ
jgi:flagellar FliL protein